MGASAIFCPVMRPSHPPSSSSDESSMYSPISFGCYSDMSGYSSSYPDSELSFPQTPLDYTAVASITSPFELFDWGLVHTFPDGRTTTAATPCTSEPSFITPGNFSPVSSSGQMSPVHDTHHVRWPSGSPSNDCSSGGSSYEEETHRHQVHETNDLPREASPKSAKPFPCNNCGKAFTRFADLKRHHSSVHFPIPQDCPVEHCLRKGNNGFPRRDHLMEHLRSYHHIDLPKRAGASKKERKLTAAGAASALKEESHDSVVCHR